jgi:class 3 adenylate cyclase
VRRDAYPAAELHLHIGLHAGEILVDGSRIYGGPVNYAARVCAISGRDEILVSQVVRDRAASMAGVTFVDRGEHVLKGIVGAHHLYAIMDADAVEPST